MKNDENIINKETAPTPIPENGYGNRMLNHLLDVV